jgi:chromosome segregation ATPase
MADPTEKALTDAVQTFSRQIADQVIEAEKRAKNAERRIQVLERRLEQEKGKRREKIQSTRKSARGLERKSNKLETELSNLKQGLEEHQEEKRRLHHRSEALTEQVNRLSEDHHSSTELFEHAQKELDKRQKSVREITQKHEATRTELLERIAASEEREEDAQARFDKKRTELQKKNRDLVQDNRRLQQQLEKELKEREQAGKNAEALKWHIRDADHAEYGPASMSELQEWAAECRIDPSHQISSDGTYWISTPDLTALGMDWVVDLADGTTFGPFHLQATRHLVETGAISREQKVRNVRTRETRLVAGLLK